MKYSEEDLANFTVEQLDAINSAKSSEDRCDAITYYEYINRLKRIEQSKKMKEIKTFEDACKATGINHEEWCKSHEGLEKDVLAYLKLRIIAQALNEGWHPQFTENEIRWWSWFYVISKEEYEAMSEELKSRCVGRGSNSAGASGGLVYAHAYNASAHSYANDGSRLAFRTRELAIYAGKQFIDIYADFVAS